MVNRLNVVIISLCTNVKSSLCTTATYNIISHYTSVNKKMGKNAVSLLK